MTSSQEFEGLPPSHDPHSFVMVVGGLGFIGSHTSLELLKEGYNVAIVDNLSNSYEHVFHHIKKLALEHSLAHSLNVPLLKFYKTDYRSSEMRRILKRYSTSSTKPRICGLIHFAAYKSVEESITRPLSYYQNNVCGLVDFLALLQEFNIKTFVFSSSATVYGAKANLGQPLREEDLVHHPEPDNTEPGITGLTSPYGRSKYFSEAILADIAFSNPDWSIISLRYFNPIGCHPSGLLGENPRKQPRNLFPILQQVLLGTNPQLEIFGTNWATHDGTAIRDFIHVVDLAKGHVAALRALLDGKVRHGFRAYNLGSGCGNSVREVIKAVEEASGHRIPVRTAPIRPGDVGCCIAATGRAEKELEWRCEKSLLDAARDSWKFASVAKPEMLCDIDSGYNSGSGDAPAANSQPSSP